MATQTTTECPGFPLGNRDENRKFVCAVCGKSVAKLGYTNNLARHKAPKDVVDAYWAGVRESIARAATRTKVYVDVETGTWGVASNLVYVNVDQDTLNNKLHYMSDSEIREWAEIHGYTR